MVKYSSDPLTGCDRRYYLKFRPHTQPWQRESQEVTTGVFYILTQTLHKTLRLNLYKILHNSPVELLTKAYVNKFGGIEAIM